MCSSSPKVFIKTFDMPATSSLGKQQIDGTKFLALSS